tara:strand:+ start:413 stop:736 length:324 start_codon:yes stop_codon:yes gene_type:complete
MNKYLINLNVGLGRSANIGTLESILDDKEAIKQLWFNLKLIFKNDKSIFFDYLKIDADYFKNELKTSDIKLNNEDWIIHIYDYEISLINISDYKSINSIVKTIIKGA